MLSEVRDCDDGVSLSDKRGRICRKQMPEMTLEPIPLHSGASVVTVLFLLGGWERILWIQFHRQTSKVNSGLVAAEVAQVPEEMWQRGGELSQGSRTA